MNDVTPEPDSPPAVEAVPDEPGAAPTGPAGPLAVLRLIRWPGAVTAAANTAAGFLLAHRPETPASMGTAIGIVASGALVYAGGVVLNDVADAKRDEELHPHRPIPSGAVPRGRAMTFGVMLLLVGVLVSFLAAGGAAALATTGAALAAVLYDFGAKRFRLLGSLCMGAARGSNAFAGALAAAGTLDALLDPTIGEAAREMATLFPIAIAIYTVMLTYVSTFEEGGLGRKGMAFLGGMLAATAILPWPLFLAIGSRLAPAAAFLLLVGSLLIGTREAMDKSHLGPLIRRAVFGFPLLDAAWLAGVGKYDWSAGWLIGYLALRFVLARARS